MSVTVNDKNLGHATAYAYAVAGGYTGTQAQFAALLASQATIAEDAESYAKGTRSGTDVASTDPAYHNNAKYYAEQAAASLANIPSDYSELADEVTSVKADFNQVEDWAMDNIAIDFSTAVVKDGIISASTGKWNAASTGRSYFVPVKTGQIKITITAQHNYNSAFAFTTDDTVTDGATPNYASGTTREVVTAGTSKTFDIPADAKYIVITYYASYTDYTPTSVTILTEKDIDTTKIKNTIFPVLLPFELVDGAYVRVGDGLIIANENFSYTNWIDLSGIKKIRYTRIGVTSNLPAHGMLFYDANKTMLSGITSVASASTSINTYFEASVPDGAKYARFSYWAKSFWETRGTFELYDVSQYSDNFTTLSEYGTKHGITHAVPISQGHLNVVRRCRQFTDIKWTPAVDLPRRSQMSGETVGDTSPVFEDVFKAGVEYTGIPYARATRHASNWGYDDMKVGWTVGFETFISAVMNPESVVSKDSVYNASAHDACFYATVCSALCSYAYGLAHYYPTNQIGTVTGMVLQGTVSDYDLTKIQLGDMLLNPTAHGAVVTDIIADDTGVKFIEISEATTIGNDDWNVEGSLLGGVCRRKMWPVSDFVVKWASYGIYRYNFISKVTYTPSPYVNTGNEGDVLRVINFPCIPYMGEGFRYKAGHIGNTKILTPACKEGLTNKLRVIKDGENWNADGTTNYYDVSGQYVEVGFTAAGEYSAYLCQVSNGEEVIKTRSCHWTVLSS